MSGLEVMCGKKPNQNAQRRQVLTQDELDATLRLHGQLCIRRPRQQQPALCVMWGAPLPDNSPAATARTSAAPSRTWLLATLSAHLGLGVCTVYDPFPIALSSISLDGFTADRLELQTKPLLTV
jgi:hypothetical protein